MQPQPPPIAKTGYKSALLFKITGARTPAIFLNLIYPGKGGAGMKKKSCQKEAESSFNSYFARK